MIHDVVGYKGAKNVEIINVTPSGDLTDVILTAGGFFDFDLNDVTKIEVKTQGLILDTTMTTARSVEAVADELEIEFGDFGGLGLDTGIYNDVEVSIYVGASEERIVIAGPSLTTQIRLTYYA
jgi:hypothetical protein